MKQNFTFFGILVLAFTVTNLLNAQSTSVFDANYFDKENTSPPIKIGKGFHMNDIYKQTRSCFTTETANPSKLTSQQTGGKKTNIKLFYTKTNEEYNIFKSRGASGKVSFLNLFSLGGQKLEEYANRVIIDEERLIFTANVDFGIYSFEIEPTLTADAKNLIEQNKLQDFVKMYGTHYISGVRKESNITVILTKSGSKLNVDETDFASMNVGGKIPFKASGSFELENRNVTNKFIENSKFSVAVEINGPAINQSVLQSQINEILNGSSENKADAIAEIIGSAIRNISDPTQSIITQYYYSPFSLYGLEGIYWDEKKQNQLAKINESIIKVYQAKSEIIEIISPSGKAQIEAELLNNAVPEQYIQQIIGKYNEIIPILKEINQQAEAYLSDLENRYTTCADVFCSNNSNCCNNDSYISEINNFNFEEKIEQEINKVMTVANDVAAELSKPECEKRKQGVIIIKNFSSNPYYIYNGDKLLETLPGNSYQTFYVNKGTYYFKAVQKSGYLLYATENNRTATINKVCQEVTLTIGYED
jgi:hypothetical protein